MVHAARNGHLNILAYLLTCDWVVDSQQREVELSQATQQALVAAASQGHEEVRISINIGCFFEELFLNVGLFCVVDC